MNYRLVIVLLNERNKCEDLKISYYLAIKQLAIKFTWTSDQKLIQVGKYNWLYNAYALHVLGYTKKVTPPNFETLIYQYLAHIYQEANAEKIIDQGKMSW